jgi:hypothetical protein
MLKFSKGNSKLNELAQHLGLKKTQVVGFDLPAGYTCGKAGICKTYANKNTGKLRRVGPVLCYAAKGEGYLPSVRALRWSNFNALLACGKDIPAMVSILAEAIDNLKNPKVIRFHSSGDFYCKEYFTAWVEVAKLYPNIQIFGYTKFLDYAVADVPDNMRVQYSFGSVDDIAYLEKSKGMIIPTCFIEEYDGQYPNIGKVCTTKDLGFEDFSAIQKRLSFAIPIH